MHRAKIITLTFCLLLAACRMLDANPPETETPTITSLPPTFTPTSEPTATPDPTSTPLPVPIPMLDIFQSLSDERCTVIETATAEAVLGDLIAPPIAFDHYDGGGVGKITLDCVFETSTESYSLEVWPLPTIEEALADYEEIIGFAGQDAVGITGLGDGAFWWPDVMRLEVVHKNYRLWVDVLEGPPEAVRQAVGLMVEALPGIDPAMPHPNPDPVDLPPDLPVPVRVPMIEDRNFDACALLSVEELEAAFGALTNPPLPGASVGEGVGYTNDCQIETDSVFVFYSLLITRTLADAQIQHERSKLFYAETNPITPVSGLGDDAFWTEIGPGLRVVSGNMQLSLTIGAELTPELQADVENLAQIMLTRLQERAEEG